MRALALIVVLSACLPGSQAAAQEPVPAVAIEAPEGNIELAPADADAFQRRLNRPPDFEEPPQTSGSSFAVISDFWAQAVPSDLSGGVVDGVADYFPEGGLVRTSVDGQDVWLVLDMRQRAILDRYIRYAEATDWGDPQPGSLDLALFAARSQTVGVELGSERLDAEESRSLLNALAGAALGVSFLEPAELPDEAGSGYWISLSLIEGRTLRYFLDPDFGLLTDSFGRERYDVSDLIGGALPSSAAAGEVEQEPPAGSDLWWILAIGGGALLLALAVVTRKRTLKND